MNHTTILKSLDSHLQDISTNLSTSIDVKIPDEIDVNVTNVSIPVSGTIAVTNDGLTDLAGAITSNKIDVNLKSNEVVSFPVTGTVAVTHDALTNLNNAVFSEGKLNVNAQCQGTVDISGIPNIAIYSSLIDVPVAHTGLTDLANAINLNKMDVNIASSAVTQPISGSVSISGTPAVTVSSGSINATCTGTVNATCSGTVAVTNSDITSVNSRQSRQSGGSLESLSVAEYKLVYKSSYAADATVFTKYYESFHSNCQFQDSDGGINIFPVTAPGYWIFGTRFHFLNGNNTWLVIYPGLVGNSSSATPSLEVGTFYWDVNGYISITNDYTAAARPVLKYVLHDINQSAGIAMSSWNVDVFDGTGASGLNLNSDTFKTYAWSWFIMLGAQTNYAYIGLVSAGKLWVGHQFSLQNPAAITSNTAKTNNIGFKPYIRNNNTTASKSVYSGGFEIYSKLGNYLNCSLVPYNFYNSYTLNTSTTIYPFAIFQQAASLASSYINLRHVYCKTIGTSDVGDFRVEIWHTIDQSYTITGGTAVNNLGSAYFHGMTSITDANAVKIATLLPNSDNCISRDISWINHKHFGFHVQGLGGYTSIVFFLVINMSASVNKTAYFSIEWSE